MAHEPAAGKLIKTKSAISSVIAACTAEESSTSLPDGIAAVNLSSLAKDLGVLLHAQCTKLSFAAKPPRAMDAVLACVDEIVKLLPAFTMLISSLRKAVQSTAVTDYIRSQVHYAMIGSRALIETAFDNEAPAGRLEQTGILWESCVKLQQVMKPDAAVSAKIKEVSIMLNDAIEDLQSFASGEDADGFEDSASEASDEHETTTTEQSGEQSEQLERRIKIVQRTLLLLKAIDKRRIGDASTHVLNLVYDNLVALVVEVDDFACEIQEAADEAFIMELEKSVLHRVEGMMSAALVENKNAKWSDWLETFRTRWLENNAKCSIEHYSQSPAYEDFLAKHLMPSQPCLIDGLAADWSAQAMWTKQIDGNLIPDYKFLRDAFGAEKISITKDNEERSTGLFSDFLDRMQNGETVYARDIHLVKHYCTPMYMVPKIFEDDWLNFYLDGCAEDDYRFVYIGSDGTRTGLHKDVVASHSWSTNLTGTKVWTLVPPSFSEYLFSKDGDCVPGLDHDQDLGRWPRLKMAQQAALRVTQRPGQTIFVPSTWFHSVVNVGPTLSINQNWINAPCLLPIFRNLVKEVAMSADAIHDLLDDGILDEVFFARTVQELTMQNAGMDFKLFFSMICYRMQASAEYSVCRPSRAYEVDILREIGKEWSKLDYARHLMDETALVESILAYC